MQGPYRLALLPLAAAVLAACASAPTRNPALEEARNLYQQAAADALVVRSAPLELGRAQAALQQADSALKAGEDIAAVEHYAYLARQRTAVAMQAGKIAAAEQAVSESRLQRDRILIDARTQEAVASRAKAQAEMLQAQRAKMDAEQARSQADQAKAQAETARKVAAEQLAAAEAARAKAGELQRQLSELQAKQTERGMVLTLGDVLFDSGRAELKPGAMRTLDQLATFLRDNPERTVTAEGYTDSVGGDTFNLGLSQRRADAVRAALTSRGIDASRITARGFGEANPVANNDTAAGRQRNRRIEVVISNAK